ncbi:hypothetical protein E8E13_001616 [Curvularia kusanoi]|uniref:DUF7580 domain-containing protein n=1 Tax=Curvularia kusanoi TaxID=90978 RepID=A0A9P4W6V0_CURKU|nr:hypothetical protein E8E13_001616 [Curvularia kusanoi]
MPLDFPETTRDLRQIGNICDTLRDCCVSKGKSPGPHCVGYLQSTGLYKHSLYLPDGIRIPDLGTKDSLSYSVEHALNQDVYNFISRVDQLQIARKLAIAVLQYNATPWLPDDWRLPDMSYLGSRSRMDSIGLRTLHLNSKITKRADTAQMEGINQARGAVTDQMREGITNPTLFHLGVAFLEIAYWCPIEAKIAECDENNPVITARRLQRDQSPPLGSKFHKITKQCLSCDFGFGDELSKRELQSAVYTSIVCGLEDLIMEFVEQGIE